MVGDPSSDVLCHCPFLRIIYYGHLKERVNMASKERNYTKHSGKTRKCDKCNKKYEVKNVRQRFCSRYCYSSWHSSDKNEESNKQRRNTGRYVWRHIKDRCNNPENKAYKDYGGKGVQCEFESLEEFQAVYFRTDECEQCGTPLNDENRRAADGRNIHRQDSNGNYCEENAMIVCKRCNNYLDRNDRRPQ